MSGNDTNPVVIEPPTLPRTEFAESMKRRGWQKGWGVVTGDGPTCIRGHIRMCAPQRGDGYLLEQVLIARGHGDEWNDAEERTEQDVLDYMATAPEVTNAEWEQVFGPQWFEMIALVRRASILTVSEASALGAAWGAARSAAWGAAWGAAWDAALDAAWDAARSAARSAALDAAWSAALDAARVLSVRDLIGDTFTQDHYDKLTGPWRTVIGPAHPDDPKQHPKDP